ncbi:MAG: ATP-binding protein [Chlamydiae bacterium]|nr:ATP-binding protein [Chlamydiota bacterium]
MASSPVSNPRFVITGAPGSGKTTIVRYINQHYHCPVVFEGAERVYNLLRAKGIENPWANMKHMVGEIERLQMQDIQEPIRLSFWDRGLQDSHVYREYYKTLAEEPPEMAEAVPLLPTKYGFNQNVFLTELDPDTSSFESGGLRTQKAEESIVLEREFQNRFASLGYHVHLIPWGPVTERVDRIFSLVAEYAPQVEMPHSLLTEKSREIVPLSIAV